MSDDTDLSTVVEPVRETMAETVDSDSLASVVEGEESARTVGRELGSRLGEELGAVVGREVGAVVALDVREREDPRTILADARDRFVELVGAVLQNADVESGVSRLVELVPSLVSNAASGELVESVTDDSETADEAGDESESQESPADESEAGDGDGGDDETEGEASESGGSADLSADELQNLKEETYRDLLEVMSYGDLQSIAKEVGVKANLSREDMIDRIAEEFPERDEE